MIHEDELPELVHPAEVDALATELERVSGSVASASEDVVREWRGLDRVFTLDGRWSPVAALTPTHAAIEAYRMSAQRAAGLLRDAAEGRLVALERRREELRGRIAEMNARVDACGANVDRAWLRWQRERADASETPDLSVLSGWDAARAELSFAEGEERALRDEIARFHVEVVDAEAALAQQLRGIGIGERLVDTDGSPVRVAEAVWGFGAGLSAPGGPARPALSLSEYFSARVADASADRVDWLASADEASATAWMAAHPGFLGMVGFVPPERAQRLYEGWASASVPDAGGAWAAGPLARLWQVAPGAVGNLNGLPVGGRAAFARAQLDRFLADKTVNDDQRAKLNKLRRVADQDDVALLSVFLDSDGEPRASLAWGNPDRADRVITLTHGINSDLGNVEGWAGASRTVAKAAAEQLKVRESDRELSVVLFMEWDSGNEASVLGDDLPGAGAAREVALVEGMRAVNPGAAYEGWAHSLGTTMTGQAVVQEPDVFDHVTLFGSAGITPEAEDVLADRIAAGEVTVSATSAHADWIAPLGEADAFSEHPVDPRDVDGVTAFGSDGGYVQNYVTATGDGTAGRATQSHNAAPSTDWIDQIPRSLALVGYAQTVSTPGVRVEPYDPGFSEPVVGYLDRRSESFMHAVGDVADRMEEVPVP